MRNKTLTSMFLLIGVVSLTAQDKKSMDREAILAMCGCYDITFKYTETFAPEIDYEKKLDYTAAAREMALPILQEDNKISIQHLLVIGDTMVIKHWRQDWEYENQEVFYYDKDNTWTFKTLPKEEVVGQWTQKVFQVDDSPRYSGSATWVHYDGKHFWENKTDAPLPRREYTKRSDYNVMLRGNRQEITNAGWVHEQDNDKVLREAGSDDVLIAQEKGWNIYTKVEDTKCAKALEWWGEHKDFWANVRTSWDGIYDREGDLSLHKSVDKKPLFMHLYPLEASNADAVKIDAVLKKFVNATPENASEGK
ncbi:MAG: DUF6607 family protein [Bacteroidota bacterium]